MAIKDNISTLRIKRHDRLQLEFKLEYPLGKSSGEVEINFWFHLPRAIGIGNGDYSPQEFYGDLRTYTRLSTPLQTLSRLGE